jgi:hypothetical protein
MANGISTITMVRCFGKRGAAKYIGVGEARIQVKSPSAFTIPSNTSKISTCCIGYGGWVRGLVEFAIPPNISKEISTFCGGYGDGFAGWPAARDGWQYVTTGGRSRKPTAASSTSPHSPRASAAQTKRPPRGGPLKLELLPLIKRP